VGPLSLAEARGTASNAPVRALDIDWDHLTDSGNAGDFVRPTFDNIVNFTYKGVLISHYNTIKAPNTTLLTNYLAANPGATTSLQSSRPQRSQIRFAPAGTPGTATVDGPMSYGTCWPTNTTSIGIPEPRSRPVVPGIWTKKSRQVAVREAAS